MHSCSSLFYCNSTCTVFTLRFVGLPQARLARDSGLVRLGSGGDNAEGGDANANAEGRAGGGGGGGNLTPRPV